MGETSFRFLERTANMYEPDFWARSAEAMELSIEGNRLIAHEIAGLVRRLWQRAMHGLDRMLASWGQHGHLPPV
jgi:hypothetical protein